LPTRLRGRSHFVAAKARLISCLPGRSFRLSSEARRRMEAKAGPTAASPATPADRIEFCNQYRPWESGQPSKYQEYFQP
jgi:hypothetical protein